MKKVGFSLLTAMLFFGQHTTAQNTSPYWSLAGNSTATSTSKLGTTNSVPLDVVTNNATRLYISTSGKIGIGTTSPQGKLHIVDQVNTGGGYYKPLRIYNPTLATNEHVQLAIGRSNSTYNQGEINFNLIGGPYSQYNTLSFGLYGNPTILTLAGTGNVGIGTLLPAYRLDVENPGAEHGIHIMNTFSGPFDQTGLYDSSVNDAGHGYGVQAYGGYRGVWGEGQGGSWEGDVIGVYGYAWGDLGTGYRYGVYGYTNDGANAYGVFGTANPDSATSFSAAGYFAGDVWAATYNTYSDRKFKQNIAPVEHGLEQLLKLKPSVYQFKTSEYKSMHLPQGKQIGLIADEVKQVFPELVKSAVHPPEYKHNTRTLLSPAVTYEGINYQGLIPVLIASVQEQQEQIKNQQGQNDALKQENKEIKERLAKLEALVLNGGNTLTLNSASLEQNTPNPVSGTTTIRYHVPENAASAVLNISNAEGKLVKTVSLSSRGTGQVALNTSALATGAYNYTLYVDDKPVDTKRFVILR